MNSDNISEKAFDADIKRQLENSSVTFDPESWEKMSQKLDSVFPDNNSGNSGFFELLIVAFLLSSFFFWNVGTFSKTNSSIVSSDNIADQISDNSPEETELSGISESGDLSNRSGNVANQASDEPIHAKSEDQVLKQDNEPENQANSGSISFKDNNAAKEPGTVITNFNFNQASTSLVLLATNDLSTDKVEERTNFERAAKVAPNTEDIELIEQQPLPDQIKGVNLNIEDPPVVQTSASPWFLGFGYGPDISLVGFSEVTKPGTNLSILLEYQLNRRWSINSGITYSNKNYTAKGEDYHPPKGFWDYGVIPDMTDGTCDVLDIPINVRYYFKPEKINRLFASTGLSTYLMLTEDYKYQYARDDPQHLVLSWSGKNENQHYFAIYNLSVGYQRLMGKRWFLEIEPFIKLPLTGVGFGEVDLWSTGASFSLKYNFR